MKVTADDNRNIRIEFEGKQASLCTLGSTMWTMPDDGKNKRFRELCNRLTPVVVAALANYLEEQE